MHQSMKKLFRTYRPNEHRHYYAEASKMLKTFRPKEHTSQKKRSTKILIGPLAMEDRRPKKKEGPLVMEGWKSLSSFAGFSDLCHARIVC
mmetsp:Transcript_80333/g.139345  ORF Transcript_80333/g.139345 Transcript_80333/m.139345 type:complete len:90 (+) Transcript_80333:39-308(+)